MAKMCACHLCSCITSYSALPVPMVHLTLLFSYEMTAVAPALFKEDGSTRTSQKSQLAKHIDGKYPNITHTPYENSVGRVYDGSALLHRLAWPKVGTVDSFCETIVGYVQALGAPDVHVCIVFDCYDRQTTKTQEQKRRRLNTGSYTDVVLDDSTPVPGNKQACLGNMVNKQDMICQLI